MCLERSNRSHRSRDARHPTLDYSSISRTYGKVGIHLKRNEKKRTGKRGIGRARAKPLSPTRVRPYLLVSSLRSHRAVVRQSNERFAFIIYLKIGIHRANKQRRMLQCIPTRENREVRRKKLPRNGDGTARESTGIEVRLSTARAERNVSPRPPPAGSRNQVVA